MKKPKYKVIKESQAYDFESSLNSFIDKHETMAIQCFVKGDYYIAIVEYIPQENAKT